MTKSFFKPATLLTLLRQYAVERKLSPTYIAYLQCSGDGRLRRECALRNRLVGPPKVAALIKDAGTHWTLSALSRRRLPTPIRALSQTLAEAAGWAGSAPILHFINL